MVDKTSTCYSVTVYNIATGYGVKIGDSVAIPEPFLQSVDFTYKEQVGSQFIMSPSPPKGGGDILRLFGFA